MPTNGRRTGSLSSSHFNQLGRAERHSMSDRRERDAIVVLTAVTSHSTGIRVAGFTGSDPNQGVAAAVNW
jgi:hypothetical protein